MKTKESIIIRVICFICVLMAVGCKSVKTATESRRETADYKIRSESRTDSVYTYRQDSVVVRIRGDTVLIDRWRLLYKYRNSADTVRLRDSVYIDQHINAMETVEVSRPTGWQWFQIWCGRILLWLALAGAAYLMYRIMK